MAPLKCGPGFSYDVRCEKSNATKVPATFSSFTSTTKLPALLTTKIVEKPLCTFGSTNLECKKVTSNILTLKPEASTTIINEKSITESLTFESSTIQLQKTIAPRLISTTKSRLIPTKTYPPKAPICYPGALDPRCLSSTNKRVVPLITTTVPNLIISTTEAEPECFPGMLNQIKIFSDLECALCCQCLVCGI